MAKDLAARFRIEPGKRAHLGWRNPAELSSFPDRAAAEDQSVKDGLVINELQDRLYAEGKRALLVVLLLAAAPVLAQEDKIRLPDGPGKDKVGQCLACHSLDYIQINSPFLNAAGWEAEVNKMTKVFGAPVEAADAKTMVEYLSKHYGK